jgi:hypothetical protein
MFEDQPYIKDWVESYDLEARANVRAAVKKWQATNTKPPGNDSGKWFSYATAVTGVIAIAVGLDGSE